MKRAAASVLSALLFLGAAAQAGQLVPVPRPKPTLGTTLPGIPVPRPKPPRPIVAPVPQTAEGPPVAGGWTSAAVDGERQRCAGLLRGLDIVYEPHSPIGTPGGCGAAAPIDISQVSGVKLEPPATTSCDMGFALHRWITGSVQPAAEKQLKTRVTVIHTASSYVCRGRNGQKGGKLSEHAKANALDMSGFTFAKSKDVTVGDGWGGIWQTIGLTRDGSFLGVIRSEACNYFTTVLGPGSDAYHGDHFHVDTIQRKNGYRICQ